MPGRLVELVFRANNRSVIRAFEEISGASDKTSRTVARNAERQRAAMRAVGRSAESVGRGMTYVGAGMAALGYAGVKTSLDFSTSMERIRTQAGASQAEVNRMSRAIDGYVASGKSAATA